MQIVDKGELAPGCCVLTGDIDGPFLDTGYVVNQETVGLFPRAYLHVPLVRQMGVAVGMVTREELAASNERIRELEDELESARREIMEAEAFIEAIHVIEKKGDYKAKKKPGRKPQASASTQEPEGRRTVKVTRRKVLSG